MPAPLIAISCPSSEGVAGVCRRPFVYLAEQYAEAVARAGGRPVLLPPAFGSDLAGIAGLLLSGGEDVDPARYGEAPDPALGDVDPGRDAHELALLSAARELDLPVLAICRGCQLVNVALGGTLFQDLPSGRPGPVAHRQSTTWEAVSHPVRFSPGPLRALAGASEAEVNSFHHQGIKALAPELEAVAESSDGLVEAFVGPTPGWLLGVQWHPEGTAGWDPFSQAIFARFVVECAQAANGRLAAGPKQAEDPRDILSCSENPKPV